MTETETTAGETWAAPAKGADDRGRVYLAIVFCLLSMASVQFGAAFSKPVMQELGPFGTTWLRLCFAALVLALFVRPPLLSYGKRHWFAAAALGTAMAMMTLCFFAAIERIPLGLAVAIDFLGPLTVATIFAGGRWRLVCPAVAAAGVLCLSWDGGAWVGDRLGVLLALGAAVGWGSYIVLMKHAGQQFTGLEGLSVSLLVAALVATPFGFRQAVLGLTPELALMAGLLALLVPLLPYALEFAALRWMKASAFGILMSLEPSIGAGAGFIVLGQELTPSQMLGVALVVTASAAGTMSRQA
ncbi:EamA family transporter [Sinorhizobium americanum]|uniref:Inner membrane transporter RhtA n=1 Tax=Sinorhizobium americanum TaxID=194963 RepID=A0A4R2BU63_9HYPH|nr:EamA family transporter [Sinorhizobium americanum]TCN31231.1 inner membrane transporter RhtA [Sinorhizobium americanum]